MDHPSNAVATARYTVVARHVLADTKDWRLARRAYRELQTAGMPRTNLLLVGTAGTIRTLMNMLQPELREPILTWRPGARLDLPSPGLVGTVVLRDVNELTPCDQDRLVAWLDLAAGQTRVVSTAAGPLWPRVKVGAFDDVLYYRLNAVSVGVVA